VDEPKRLRRQLNPPSSITWSSTKSTTVVKLSWGARKWQAYVRNMPLMQTSLRATAPAGLMPPSAARSSRVIRTISSRIPGVSGRTPNPARSSRL